MNTSGKFTLNAQDWKKIGIGLLVALAGGLIVFLTDLTEAVDFGIWAPIVAAGASVVVNVLRKWATNYQGYYRLPGAK